MIRNKELKRRIIDISFAHKLSHLGSCLTAVDIITDIYKAKAPDEKFVLSQGHAGLALYAVMEQYGLGNAESMLISGGIHPDRLSQPVDCSTGSLGHGLGIAVGMAMSNRKKKVYCLISDGECAEGSIWEALRIADDNNLTNLKIYINLNGYGAYSRIDTEKLKERLRTFENIFIEEYHTNTEDFPFLHDIDAHYHIMTNEEYDSVLNILEEVKVHDTSQ